MNLYKIIPKNTTQVMVILNLTPDSFSDGGELQTMDSILQAAQEALETGAHVLDVGGESTRPGAITVSVEEECQRIVPAIQQLHHHFPNTLISVDTRKATVAKAAIQAGAGMINDISGLQYDAAMAQVAAETEAYLVIMHSQGPPETMQQNPTYIDVVKEVFEFFRQQVDIALQAGVQPEKIYLDPGFGFGKTLEHNLALLKNLSYFKTLGFPLLIGTSRKSFLTLGNPNISTTEREALTAASLTLSIQQGIDMVRIHDYQTQIPVIRFLDQVFKR